MVSETARLVLRELTATDAEFILELLNDPAFIRFIGDKGARTLDDARQYIADGPRASYAANSFGLYLVQTKAAAQRIGICGLVKRDVLQDIDIGFAFLPAFRSQGFALESCRAVMHLARNVFGIERVVAITSTDNHGSMRLLEKIGLRFDRAMTLPGHSAAVNLFTPLESADAAREFEDRNRPARD